MFTGVHALCENVFQWEEWSAGHVCDHGSGVPWQQSRLARGISEPSEQFEKDPHLPHPDVPAFPPPLRLLH